MFFSIIFYSSQSNGSSSKNPVDKTDVFDTSKGLPWIAPNITCPEVGCITLCLGFI